MSANGQWKITLSTPMGPQEMTATFAVEGGTLTGQLESPMGSEAVNGTATGDRLAWTTKVTKPMPIELDFDVTVEGDALKGTAKLGMFGNAAVTGSRLA